MPGEQNCISRRDIIRLTGAAVSAVAVGSIHQSLPAETAKSMGERRKIPINDNWKFIRRDVAGAEKTAFNDATWGNVSLPHTYNGLDGERHGHYYRGPTWYRRVLTLPDVEQAGEKNYFLYFEGAATTAEVYVNGRHVGTHRGNFAGFCFDVTGVLQPKGKNSLAVRVSNKWDKNIPPLAGDFNIFGGLYRTAHLLILNPVSLSPLDYGSPGVYILQESVSRKMARLKLTAMLRNATTRDTDVSVDWYAIDHNGHVVATAHHTGHMSARTQQEVVSVMELEHPHLWHGRKDPYLYTMLTIVRQAGRAVDTLTQPLGLRYFHIDPDQGFFLNGEAYPLRGVCTHDDRPKIGRAVTKADYLQDCAMINDLGATSVRLAHYQHDQTMYDAFDRSGVVVWTEDGLVNHIEEQRAFDENARQQFIELVKQNYNHPCVFVWSLYNELAFKVAPYSQTKLDFPSTPVLKSEYRFESLPATEFTLPWDIIYDLNALAHNMDPSRLTVAATDQHAASPINYITDIISFNRYEGWYGGTPEDWPITLDRIRRHVHQRMPGRVIGLSEYGAGANVQQHEYPVRQPRPGGQWHPEEWQCVVHEAAYRAIRQRPWLWNTTLWVMFDFSSAGRNEGADPGRNDKGLVTYDRKIKKDAYFFYKAQWTTQPFVHICDRRYSPRPAGSVAIKVYCNCPVVELFINGRSQGIRNPVDHVFIWPAVTLPAGIVHVSATTTDSNGHVYRDEYKLSVVSR